MNLEENRSPQATEATSQQQPSPASRTTSQQEIGSLDAAPSRAEDHGTTDRVDALEGVAEATHSGEPSQIAGGMNAMEPPTYEHEHDEPQLGEEAQPNTPVSTTPPYLFTTPKKRLLSLPPQWALSGREGVGPSNVHPLAPPQQSFSVTDMFSNEFMQSVANQLEDFDSNLFRPDGDINFERDFSQWFYNPDDVGAMDMKP